MKRHFACAFLVILLCFCFIFCERKNKTPLTYKVLDVDNLSRICIDLDFDLKCSADEYFYLKHVSLYFEGEKSLTKVSNDCLRKLLKAKEITLIEPLSPFLNTAKIAVDGVDAAYILLKEGYARAEGKNIPSSYVFWESVVNLSKNREIFKQKYQNKRISEKETVQSAAPDFITGSVAAYFIEPYLYSMPSKRARTNLAKSIIYGINNAKSSVYAALYGIEQQEEILSALTKAKERGVDVKVVCEKLQTICEYKAKRVPILPETVTIELLKPTFASLKAIPVGINKETLEISYIDILANGIYTITGEDISSSANFIQTLVRMTQQLEGVKSLVIDGNSFLNDKELGAATYVNGEKIKESLEAIYQDQSNLNVCLIMGLNVILNKVDVAEKSKITELLDRVKSSTNVRFIIVDTIDNIKALNYELWFKNNASLSEGIWLGNGLANQFTLKVTTSTRVLRAEVEAGFGYIIKKGKAELIKLVTED